MQETITYLELSCDGLAQEVSMPDLVPRDAVDGKVGLTRGQWVKFARLLGLANTYQLRPGERDGAALLGNLLSASCSRGEQNVDRRLTALNVPLLRPHLSREIQPSTGVPAGSYLSPEPQSVPFFVTPESMSELT